MTLRTGRVVCAVRAAMGTEVIALHSRQARRLVTSLALAASVILAPAGSTLAGEVWVATKVRGTVLMLANGEWSELPAGEEIGPTVPVRTLQSGRVELTNGEAIFELGPVTALQFEPGTGPRTTVTLYAGTVAVDTHLSGGRTLVLQTPSMRVTLPSGHTALRLEGDSGRISVAAGTVAVVDTSTGTQQKVASGQSTSAAAIAAATTAGSQQTGTGGKGNGSNANASSHTGGSNAGGNGNGNGNGGSNSSGAGNGSGGHNNSGGNGNGGGNSNNGSGGGNGNGGNGNGKKN